MAWRAPSPSCNAASAYAPMAETPARRIGVRPLHREAFRGGGAAGLFSTHPPVGGADQPPRSHGLAHPARLADDRQALSPPAPLRTRVVKANPPIVDAPTLPSAVRLFQRARPRSLSRIGVPSRAEGRGLRRAPVYWTMTADGRIVAPRAKGRSGRRALVATAPPRRLPRPAADPARTS